jgi:hypothetical protein
MINGSGCDWSSDVCSSDLAAHFHRAAGRKLAAHTARYGQSDTQLERRVAELPDPAGMMIFLHLSVYQRPKSNLYTETDS